MSRKKRNKKRKIIIPLLIIVIATCIALYIANNKHEMNNKETKKNEIESHYSKYVITTKETNLYIKDNDAYEETGKIAKDEELTIKDMTINYDTEYFNIDGLENYYIYYNDVKKIETLKTLEDRYKTYIPFNENIITIDKTIFYDDKDNLIYQINKSFNLPIIIKDKDKYGIEYNNRLLYVKTDDIKETKENNNTDMTNTKGIPVLNYHFFYDASSKEDSNKCTQIICLSTEKLKQQLDYIKENKIFTPTMKELEMYIDKKINLPKSIVLTIDDGWRADIGSNIMADYKLNGTVFLITNDYYKGAYENEYIEVHSHSNNLHKQGDCPTGQGGGIQCLPKDVLLKDLKTSREKLNNTTVFCYPFYEYNNYSIEVLKEAGFTMAFGGHGEGGNYKVSPGINKYKLPRYIIYNDTTLEDLKSYIN